MSRNLLTQLILVIVGNGVVVNGQNFADLFVSAAMRVEEVRPTTDLINKYGYPAEAHHTVTEDGYILRIDRIPRPQAPVVLVGNPLFCNSACFVGLQNESLAFKLYNEGYDVWLGNFRGSGLSKNHTNYTILDRQFWNYSLHEHGVIDIPAMVDYVLAATGKPSLLYSGHSMGATSWFITAALRPDYEQRISAVFLMGPVASLAHHRSPMLDVLHPFENVTLDFETAFGPHMLPGSNSLLRFLGGLFCRTFVPPEDPSHCLAFAILGELTAGGGNLVYPAYFQYYVPSGVSMLELLHYIQQANRNWPGFRQFNHGAAKNRQLYGQSVPPDYSLSNTSVPAYLYTGRTDIYVSPEDLAFLTTSLKDVKKVYQVPENTFGHLDYVLNPKAPILLYDTMIADMASFLENQE
ncbi:lipase 1-like [Frankliniella occidentalis]|uniref:Lipase n=1 Tax=Frankliniella occidentalis TaxID=133901 RepID=A0A6J1S7T8_FRAOC|nr:lipase 1-like [Frankliniella occidentalis]